MRILLCFAAEKNVPEAPWLVDAVDEYTIDNCGGVPEGYTERVAAAAKDCEIREVWIAVDDVDVTNRFRHIEILSEVVS